jgi:tetratricopeptide (TPR) repeat protein
MNDYQKALSSFNKAMKYFHKGDFDKAKQSLEDFIKSHSEEKELLDRAKIYLDIIQARGKKESIPLKSFDDYYQYGIFRLNQGRYEDAMDLFKKANKKKAKQAKVYYAMAHAYCLMDEKDKCIANLRKAVKLDEFYGILAQNETYFDVFREDEEFNSIFE